MLLTARQLIPDITYKLSRSGGKGGQHVNKVSSKAELNFDLRQSGVFTPGQKERILDKLSGRLTADGKIQVICEDDRSQYKNKQLALDRLQRLLVRALFEPPIRKPTKIPRRVKEGRMEDKRRKAMKKILRSGGFF